MINTNFPPHPLTHTPSDSIQSVDATENGLTSLPPPYAWKSRAVRDIKMTGNRLTKLDLSDAGKFWPHMECLYLGDNKLKEVSILLIINFFNIAL